jgi:uncharacterized protein
MIKNKEILLMIVDSIKSTNQGATIILYGSSARGDDKKDSDIDLLILLDKEKITREDEKKLKYPLYDIEFETGKIISPLVLSKKDWETKHKITPFYENVVKEGILL